MANVTIRNGLVEVTAEVSSLQDVLTRDDLRQMLGLAPAATPVAVVNGLPAQGNTELEDGDTVALRPAAHTKGC